MINVAQLDPKHAHSPGCREKKAGGAGGGAVIYLPTAEFHLITLLEADFIPAYRLGSEDLFCASLAGGLKTQLLLYYWLAGQPEIGHFASVSGLVEQ